MLKGGVFNKLLLRPRHYHVFNRAQAYLNGSNLALFILNNRHIPEIDQLLLSHANAIR